MFARRLRGSLLSFGCLSLKSLGVEALRDHVKEALAQALKQPDDFFIKVRHGLQLSDGALGGGEGAS